MKKETYWKIFMGIPCYKIEWYFKYLLYKLFGFAFDKLNDQKEYWNTRGKEYFDDLTKSNKLEYEVFFQDILIYELKKLKFNSFFEAGCGFGWNVKRIKKEFPEVRIGGVDFSFPQLQNSRKYLPDIVMPVAMGDACCMPFGDNAFEVGFTLGVYMNIHPDKIGMAIDEMIRVSKKYIIHLEWDQDNATPDLKEKRIIKTNIISHDYKNLYESRGKQILEFKTYKNYREEFDKRFKSINVDTWEQFEGPEKYILIVVKV